MNLYSYVGGDPINWYDPNGYARKGNKGDGSATGKGTLNPYKHCRQHPTKPDKLICKRKRDGKKVVVPKPPGWDEHNARVSLKDGCDSCLTPYAALVKAGIITAGATIIIIDIITFPSGEGACGIALIRYAFAR